MSGRISHLFKAALVSSTLLAPGLATAEPQRGNLGGGFIEMLMTGQAPAQQRQGAPAYNAPAQPGYFARSRNVPTSYPQPGVRRRAEALPPPAHRVMYQTPQGAVPLAVHTQSVHTQPVHPQSVHARLDDPYQQGVPLPGRGPHQERAAAPMASAFDPRFEKQEVPYAGPHAAGTLVVDTPNRFLYLVQGQGRALRYGIGVGRPGFEWAGMKTVSMKREWPDWRPPAEMLKRRPDLPTHMAGGPDNPLGARALYLGSSLYRIHGTNEPETIGRAVSSGCIRMRNEDVVDLYGRVKVGSRVLVM